LHGIERSEAASYQERLLRLELHAWERAHAVLRGRDGSNVVSLPDYLKGYRTIPEARDGLDVYFPRYNTKRKPPALDYKTPAEVFFDKS
jgi:hypothetical protein